MMRYKNILILLLFAQPVVAAGMDSEAAEGAERTYDSQVEPIEGAPRWQASGVNELHGDDPLINCPGCGFGGADESVLQTKTLGMNTLGFGHQAGADNRVAEDFVVPEGQTWDCDTLTFFAYQTGSDTQSTISAVTLRIWDGVPGMPESEVVFGDLETNRMIATAWSGFYRVTEETTGSATDRPIMANEVSCAGVTLSTGHYWLDWDTDGTLVSGPWAPPIAVSGAVLTGNAYQSTDGGLIYDPITDTGGTQTPQGLPFILSGTTTGPTVTVSGSCPGSITLAFNGGTPNGELWIGSSAWQGANRLREDDCEGTVYSLGSPHLATIQILDEAGELTVEVPTNDVSCGLYIQAVDRTTCSASTFDRVPSME